MYKDTQSALYLLALLTLRTQAKLHDGHGHHSSHSHSTNPSSELNAAACAHDVLLLAWDITKIADASGRPLIQVVNESTDLSSLSIDCHHLRVEHDLSFSVNDPLELDNETHASIVHSHPHGRLLSAATHLDRVDQRYLPLDKQYDPGDESGSGSIIYVLDSGIYAAHSEFEGRVLPGEGKWIPRDPERVCKRTLRSLCA